MVIRAGRCRDVVSGKDNRSPCNHCTVACGTAIQFVIDCRSYSPRTGRQRQSGGGCRMRRDNDCQDDLLSPPDTAEGYDPKHRRICCIFIRQFPDCSC